MDIGQINQYVFGVLNLDGDMVQSHFWCPGYIGIDADADWQAIQCTKKEICTNRHVRACERVCMYANRTYLLSLLPNLLFCSSH